MTKPDRILDKIKKCLALATSGNEHEAEAALRQARKMMAAHGITEDDVRASEASEHTARAGAKTKPVSWEVLLASKIADAFACDVIFIGGYAVGRWGFIGCGSCPEIAQYAFTVLLRQARQARNDYIKQALKRCKPINKTRRADLFCEGWVYGVTRTVGDFAGTPHQKGAIEAYMAKHRPSLSKLVDTNRNHGRALRDHEHSDYCSGSQAGRAAQLHHGVGGQQTAPGLLGHKGDA